MDAAATPNWLFNIIVKAVGALPKTAGGIVDQVKKKLVPLDFAIFGYRATGKTTFLNRMRYGIPTEPEPTPYKYEELDTFQICVVGRPAVKVGGVYDVAGESKEEFRFGVKRKALTWPLWEEIFLGQSPRGIIFMIDHENAQKSKAALRYVIEMISRSDPPASWWSRFIHGRKRTKARKGLKIFMLLVNKIDIWERQGLTADKILLDYTQEITDLINFLQRNKSKFYQEAISAKFGTNCEKAVQNFILGLLAVS